jgi:SAM-dependent methyltransferase
LFRQAFADWPASRFLELGAGNGEITVRLAQVCPALLAHYVVSERFLTAAGWLRRQGLLACVLDARHIPFADCSFDAVIAFDVLHHVAETQRMAGEMARVARRRLFLVEANGLSLGRKAMELTAGHRAAGERSYTPWQYRAIFARATGRLCRFEAHPFLFPLPGGVPASLLASWVRLNRVLERVPLLRWQCSNVWIRIDLAD